jgi:alditol oxidase
VRPHWGKLFSADAAALERVYPRIGDFRALAARLDPSRVFVNEFLERTVLPG